MLRRQAGHTLRQQQALPRTLAAHALKAAPGGSAGHAKGILPLPRACHCSPHAQHARQRPRPLAPTGRAARAPNHAYSSAPRSTQGLQGGVPHFPQCPRASAGQQACARVHHLMAPPRVQGAPSALHAPCASGQWAAGSRVARAQCSCAERPSSAARRSSAKAKSTCSAKARVCMQEQCPEHARKWPKRKARGLPRRATRQAQGECWRRVYHQGAHGGVRANEGAGRPRGG